jgi:hypothetical protein
MPGSGTHPQLIPVYKTSRGYAGMQASVFTRQNIVATTWSTNRLFNYLVFFLFISLNLIVSNAFAGAGDAPGHHTGITVLSLPSHYGKVVYISHEKSPNTLYIVGISHRGSHSRRNGRDTAKTQTEVYRIGEWLNRNLNLDLLLPEGFFNSGGASTPIHSTSSLQPMDDAALERTLADNSHFLNAEMLLMQRFHMPAGQVENRKLYNEILSRIIRMESHPDNIGSYLSLEMQIDRLQEKRTAVLLNNIPTVIESEFKKGAIKYKNAMFTIGLNHIKAILHYLKETQKTPETSASSPSRKNPILTNLGLKYSGFNVVVIIPHTLITDRQILRRMELIGLI